MNFEEVIRNRSAVRKFSDKVLEEDILNKILEAGRLAPTAKNIQPIKIYVVRSIENLSKIDNASPCRYGAQTVLIICGNKEEAFHNEKCNTYETDASIVGTHIMLEATNLGVDNLWVRGFDSDIIKSEFNLPNNLEPVLLMPLGYKTEDCPVNPMHTIRKNIEDIVEYL